jgi:hypothetical protein
MIKAATYNINVYEGDSGIITFQFPQTFIIENCEALLQVRKDFKSPAICTFTNAYGFTIDDNDLILTIKSEDTQDKAGEYKYDLQITRDDIETVLKGSFNILPDVSR